MGRWGAGTGALLCAMLSGVVGCDLQSDAPDLSSEPEGPSVQDSAGIQLVSNPERPPAGVRWSIDSVPSLRIGHDEALGEEYVFGSVVDAVMLSDGSIVVADGQAGDVRRYDPSGRYLGRMARPGMGPGETRGVSALTVLRGDTVLVHSPYSEAPIVVLGPDGESPEFWYAPSATELGLDVGSYGQSRLIDAFSDGTLLVAARARTATRAEGSPFRVPVMVEETARIVRVDWEHRVLADFGDHVMVRNVIYDDRPVPGWMEVSPDYLPQSSFVAGDQMLYVAEGSEFQVLGYGAGGSPGLLLRKEHTPIEIPEAWSNSRWGAIVDQVSRMEGLEWMGSAPPPPVPAHAPAIMDLIADINGDLWVLTAPSGQPELAEWFVFSPDGVLRASLDASVRPVQVGETKVLAIIRGDHDVQTVALFELQKPHPPAPGPQTRPE